jgi:hypothetical protein
MDDPGSLIVRFCLDGPLLYLALYFAIDPSASVTSLNNLTSNFAAGLWRFENQLLGRPFAAATPEPRPVADNARTRIVVRLTGFVLAVAAILHFTGLAR